MVSQGKLGLLAIDSEDMLRSTSCNLLQSFVLQSHSLISYYMTDTEIYQVAFCSYQITLETVACSLQTPDLTFLCVR